MLISRNIEKLSSTALEIQKVRKGCKTRIGSFDFGSSTKVDAYKGIFDKIKDLDVSVLVNNVGLSAPGGFSSKSDTEIFNMTAVNVYPIILLTKFFL